MCGVEGQGVVDVSLLNCVLCCFLHNGCYHSITINNISSELIESLVNSCCVCVVGLFKVDARFSGVAAWPFV